MDINTIRRMATGIADEMVKEDIAPYSNLEDLDKYIDDALIMEDLDDEWRESLFLEIRKRLSTRVDELNSSSNL